MYQRLWKDQKLKLCQQNGWNEDSIAATIDETQPAALSEGEFVVPADVVSFAGNGSSEAGARKFYKMLGDIREASTGQREQIKEIDVEEYMPMSDGIGALA